MGGGSAPKPDKNVGKAALESSKLGRDYLSWMKERAKTTDAWARQDRGRDLKFFRPMQNDFIRDAKAWDSPYRGKMAAREAVADVAGEGARARQQTVRSLTAMGVNPNANRFVDAMRGGTIDLGLAKAGAATMARRRVKSEGMALRGEAINMGRGLGINPLSASNAGTSAGSSGFQGAIGATGQAGSLHAQDYSQRMQAHNAQQQGTSDLFGALGLGAGIFMSDEKSKTKKRKARGVTEQVRKMRVDEWEYRPDAPGGDGGGVPHVGTYAQDFQKATGKGDGTTIPVVDAIGVNLAAVKEIDQRVRRIERSIKAAA